MSSFGSLYSVEYSAEWVLVNGEEVSDPGLFAWQRDLVIREDGGRPPD